MSVKALRKYKILAVILVILNLAVFLYNFIGEGSLLKGELGDCEMLSQEEETEVKHAKSKLEAILSKEKGPVFIQSELIATRDAIAEGLGDAEFVKKRDCTDNLAFVDEVLDFPEGYGLCIYDTESIPDFLENMAQENIRQALKEKILVYLKIEKQVLALSAKDKKEITEAERYISILEDYNTTIASNDICSIGLDEDELDEILAQFEFLSS